MCFRIYSVLENLSEWGEVIENGEVFRYRREVDLRRINFIFFYNLLDGLGMIK